MGARRKPAGRRVKEGPAVYGGPEKAAESLELVTIEDAALAVGKTPSNLSYYLQAGRISRYNEKGERVSRAQNGKLRVSLREIRTFLDLVRKGLEKHHHEGLHPELGFYDLPEYKRTKHVHRLHPYLGKFIPQLVEWFLARFFKEGDIILDPFVGSGTTLVQANEMAMHSVGIEISPFNCLIARVKLARYDVHRARREILDIERRLLEFSRSLVHIPSLDWLALRFNKAEALAARLLDNCHTEYLRTWFAPRALVKMLYCKSLIPEYEYQDLLRVLLSRAVRSSRLVPHYDLATPRSPLPVGKKYWCKKHSRWCRPIEDCLTKFHTYGLDTVRRLAEFERLRSNCEAVVIQGDSTTVDIRAHLIDTVLVNRPLDGIFTSPPYVGQIDYHDQHRYAYELFGFPRQDHLEIGPKQKGKSLRAQEDYIEGISAVFRKVLSMLRRDAKVFVVANDRFGLYPEIAKRSGLRTVDEFHRAVTKRTEQGDDPYQETIFLMLREI
jgi:hypothetical protein